MLSRSTKEKTNKIGENLFAGAVMASCFCAFFPAYSMSFEKDKIIDKMWRESAFYKGLTGINYKDTLELQEGKKVRFREYFFDKVFEVSDCEIKDFDTKGGYAKDGGKKQGYEKNCNTKDCRVGNISKLILELNALEKTNKEFVTVFCDEDKSRLVNDEDKLKSEKMAISGSSSEKMGLSGSRSVKKSILDSKNQEISVFNECNCIDRQTRSNFEDKVIENKRIKCNKAGINFLGFCSGDLFTELRILIKFVAKRKKPINVVHLVDLAYGKIDFFRNTQLKQFFKILSEVNGDINSKKPIKLLVYPDLYSYIYYCRKNKGEKADLAIVIDFCYNTVNNKSFYGQPNRESLIYYNRLDKFNKCGCSKEKFDFDKDEFGFGKENCIFDKEKFGYSAGKDFGGFDATCKEYCFTNIEGLYKEIKNNGLKKGGVLEVLEKDALQNDNVNDFFEF